MRDRGVQAEEDRSTQVVSWGNTEASGRGWTLLILESWLLLLQRLFTRVPVLLVRSLVRLDPFVQTQGNRFIVTHFAPDLLLRKPLLFVLTGRSKFPITKFSPRYSLLL